MDSTVAKKHLSQEEADAALSSLPLTEGARELERIAEEEDEPFYKPPLISVLQSEYEAAEEQRRFVNYDSMLNLAKKRIAKEESTGGF